ncbi:MAG TPA: hypothetical protein VD794_01275 [Flavisolibacter sp.]|nr:hypothetical protein [Flavisolibacter sp.]
MTQIELVKTQLEELENRLLLMLGKLAVGGVMHLFILCWFYKIQGFLEWMVVTIIILMAGFYFYQRWYKRCMRIRKNISLLNKELERFTKRQQTYMQYHFGEALYIRRS